MDERLPPGLRFHPTDKELLSFYLRKKKNGKEGNRRIAISELDLYDREPWDLPTFSIRQFLGRIPESLSTQEEGGGDVKEVVQVEDKAGDDDEGEEDGEDEESEKDCYVFHTLDRKYHRGSRSNRATRRGYWKATGKVKNVFSSSSPSTQLKLLGTKKVLVFYQGRAPHGKRTDWVMHEYQLAEEEEELEKNGRTLVLCRIRRKSRPVQLSSPDEKSISNSSPCNVGRGNAEGNGATDRPGFRPSSSSSSPLPPHTNSSRHMNDKYHLEMICKYPNPEYGSIHHHPGTPFLSL